VTIDTIAAAVELWIGVVSYDNAIKAWLQSSDHYLNNAPPGCLFAIGVRESRAVLFDEIHVGVGPLLGICLVGRPVARQLPQDGSIGEITRLWLMPELPHGTASAVLRTAASVAKGRGMRALISYHDRTRHTGCIYRKAGFRRDGVVKPNATGWASRDRANSATAGATPKRRWRLNLETI